MGEDDKEYIREMGRAKNRRTDTGRTTLVPVKSVSCLTKIFFESELMESDFT